MGKQGRTGKDVWGERGASLREEELSKSRGGEECETNLEGLL